VKLTKDDIKSFFKQEEGQLLLKRIRAHAAEKFRTFFINRLTYKLDSCPVHICGGKHYTADQDIIDAYESITAQEWFDLFD